MYSCAILQSQLAALESKAYTRATSIHVPMDGLTASTSSDSSTMQSGTLRVSVIDSRLSRPQRDKVCKSKRISNEYATMLLPVPHLTQGHCATYKFVTL